APFRGPPPLPKAGGRPPSRRRVDLAGAVAVRDDARERDLARSAGAALHVGGIDAGGRELDAHLAGPGPRRLDVADSEHLRGRAVLLVPGCAHDPFLSARWVSPLRGSTHPTRQIT